MPQNNCVESNCVESDEGEAKSASDDSSDDGEQATAQMDPLELRFSQKKMRNVFADGKLIDESAELVRAVRRPPDETEIYGAPWRLEAPFPPIEVIRWRCKMRDDTTGRPLVNEETGEQLFEPEESWFTLDNRRLYCLQQAAIRLLPERCTAGTVIEIRKDRRLREIRKFRTLDSGKSINVGSVVDGVPFVRWCWSNAKKNAGKNSNSSRNKGKGAGHGGPQKNSHKGSKGDESDQQTTSKGKGRHSAKGSKGDKGYGQYKGESHRDYYYYHDHNGWKGNGWKGSWYGEDGYHAKGGKGGRNKKNTDGNTPGGKASGRGGPKGGKGEKIMHSEPSSEQQ